MSRSSAASPSGARDQPIEIGTPEECAAANLHEGQSLLTHESVQRLRAHASEVRASLDALRSADRDTSRPVRLAMPRGSPHSLALRGITRLSSQNYGEPITDAHPTSDQKAAPYDLLERWYQPGLPASTREERMQLESEGHERWLKRGRLTAEMTVALLDHTLLSWEAMGEERPRHPADERSRIVWRLRGQMAAQANVDPEHRECLLALERLDATLRTMAGHTSRSGLPGNCSRSRNPPLSSASGGRYNNGSRR